MSKKILEIKNLRINLMSTRGIVYGVRDISLDVNEGEILGIVGESGCGKTMTAKSILRLHDEKKLIYQGEINYQGEENILKMSDTRMRKLRGADISMIFQDPMTTFNPLHTIGKQMVEMLCVHTELNKSQAKEKALELLEDVGIHPAIDRFKQYPFEMSGGMLQRVSIAMALSCNPKMLIADEPTTALDVTMQAQVLEIMKKLQQKNRMAVMIITHNFGVVAEVCDRVSVMYAGNIIETGNVSEIFHGAKHPYTQDLIDSIPKADYEEQKLVTIAGSPPDLRDEIIGCPYAPRCRKATEKCKISMPESTVLSDTHNYRCHNA